MPDKKAPERDAGILVIGLGRFGSAIAETLDRLGQDVLAVERDPNLVAQYSGRMPLVEADASNPEALEQLGAKDFGVAVVGVGTSLEASVLITGNLVDMGTPQIWAKAITAEHGWPTYDLVGEDGEDAAWAIAQHSDQDRDFQLCALEHLRIAVDAGQGSPGNLAYLSDRVAVSGGEPQRYGTQVGCGPDGPEPATPLAEPDGIDAARAEVGLPPYADYLAEMEAVCAETG